MNDQDNTLLAAAAANDNDVNPNQDSHGGSIGIEKVATTNESNDDGSAMTPTGKVIGNDDAKRDPNSIMKTILEGEKPPDFHPLREEEIMAMTNEFSKEIDDQNKHIYDSSASDTFVIPPAADGAALMDSTTVDGNDKNNDSDSAPVASQSTCGGGDPFFGHDNDESRIALSLSSGREHLIGSYLGPSDEDIAPKAFPRTANNVNKNGDQPESKNGGQQESGELEPSAATQHLIQNVSSDLDQKLDNVRSWTKRLLQELSVYVTSNNAVTSEYGRIREEEGAEKNRLDGLESNVNGASTDVVRRSIGERGTPIATTPTPIQRGKQQQRVPPGNRHRRHSLGPSNEALQPHCDRPLTPKMTNKRRRSCFDRIGGKENRGKKRVSFGS